MAVVCDAPEIVHRGKITGITHQGEGAVCALDSGAPVIVSAVLAQYLSAGDEIEAPLGGQPTGTEIRAVKAQGLRSFREIYQAPIGYVTQPKENKRRELFVAAEVQRSRLAIAGVDLPCHALRDYFYVSDRRRPWGKQPTLYEMLRIATHAKPAELRLSYKIRLLELQKEGTGNAALRASERAFNILAHPDLRACYDGLLNNPDAPTLFPYSGFGSLLVAGTRSSDGKTFFASRILAFLPEMRRQRFHAPLHKFEFYDDRAVYRDARRKLELLVDQSAMPVVWDQGWNRWKHLRMALHPRVDWGHNFTSQRPEK